MFEVVAWGGIICFFGGIIWLCLYFGKRRRQELMAVASSLGLAFRDDNLGRNPPELAATTTFGAFQYGTSRTFANLLHGNRDGIAVRIFDYSYDSGVGENRSGAESTMVLLTSADFALPFNFEIYPEGVFAKMGAALGGQDIDLAEYPEFSRRFILKGSDANAVRSLIDPATAAFFESHKGISVMFNGQDMLVFRGWRKVKSADIHSLLDDALAAFRLIAARSSQGPASV